MYKSATQHGLIELLQFDNKKINNKKERIQKHTLFFICERRLSSKQVE